MPDLWCSNQCDRPRLIGFENRLLCCFLRIVVTTHTVSTLAVFAELKVDPTLFYLVFGESVLNDAVVSDEMMVLVQQKLMQSVPGHRVVSFIQGHC